MTLAEIGRVLGVTESADLPDAHCGDAPPAHVPPGGRAGLTWPGRRQQDHRHRARAGSAGRGSRPGAHPPVQPAGPGGPERPEHRAGPDRVAGCDGGVDGFEAGAQPVGVAQGHHAAAGDGPAKATTPAPGDAPRSRPGREVDARWPGPHRTAGGSNSRATTPSAGGRARVGTPAHVAGGSTARAGAPTVGTPTGRRRRRRPLRPRWPTPGPRRRPPGPFESRTRPAARPCARRRQGMIARAGRPVGGPGARWTARASAAGASGKMVAAPGSSG